MKKKSVWHVFSDAYEGMKNAVTRTHNKKASSPESMYSNIVGYENTPATANLIKKLKKREKLIETNERRGKTSKDKRNLAATNAFMLGDIYRYNELENAQSDIDRERAREMAGDYYTRAMLRIGNHAVDTVTMNETADGPTIDTMIDRAAEFFREHSDLPPNVEINFDNLRETARNARTQVYCAPIPASSAKTKRKPGQSAKQHAQENFYAQRNIRSDPQNVHEPQVSNEIEHIYKIIQHENDKEEMVTGGALNRVKVTPNAIKKEVEAYKFSDEETKKRALSVLETMSRDNSITKLHDTEKNVLINVWKRINSSDNQGNRENLKDSFMDALANGMEKNYSGDYVQVCTNGRCSRIINSLTLIDASPEISKPVKTRDMMKNEILSSAYAIVQEELSKTTPDVAKAYSGSTPESQINEELQGRVDSFVQDVKDKIDKKVRKDYENQADQGAIDNFILDAQAGV
jgi:hypothetical protein